MRGVKTANVAYRGEHVLEDRSGDGVLREPRDVSSKTVASQSQAKDHDRCEAHNATKDQIRPAASRLAWFHLIHPIFDFLFKKRQEEIK